MSQHCFKYFNIHWGWVTPKTKTRRSHSWPSVLTSLQQWAGYCLTWINYSPAVQQWSSTLCSFTLWIANYGEKKAVTRCSFVPNKCSWNLLKYINIWQQGMHFLKNTFLTVMWAEACLIITQKDEIISLFQFIYNYDANKDAAVAVESRTVEFYHLCDRTKSAISNYLLITMTTFLKELINIWPIKCQAMKKKQPSR